MKNRPHGLYELHGHTINDEHHSMFVMFHPYQEQKMPDTHHNKAMALAICGVADYVIKSGLTARYTDHNIIADNIS